MAGIIKAGKLDHVGEGQAVAAFQFEDLTERARRYLEEAKRQAAQIVEQAKQQAEQVRGVAQEAGRRDALAEAEKRCQQKVDQQLQRLLPALQEAVQSIQHSRQTWLNHWEGRTVELAAAIARRIVRRELTQTPDIALEWVREALQLSLGQGQIQLFLHPEEIETLGPRVEHLLARLGTLGEAQVLADPELGPGGCRVVTAFGSVDQSLDAQLTRIGEELT